MYGITPGRRTFRVEASLIVAMILVISAVTFSPSSGQSAQTSTSNQTKWLFDVNTLTGAENVTQNSNTMSNITKVSIVPEAAALEDKAYRPNPVEIRTGQSVVWTNNDLTTHTVTEGDPATSVPANGFDSGLLSPEQTFRHTFDKNGTIAYHCTLHPTMVGKVIVT